MFDVSCNVQPRFYDVSDYERSYHAQHGPITISTFTLSRIVSLEQYLNLKSGLEQKGPDSCLQIRVKINKSVIWSRWCCKGRVLAYRASVRGSFPGVITKLFVQKLTSDGTHLGFSFSLISLINILREYTIFFLTSSLPMDSVASCSRLTNGLDFVPSLRNGTGCRFKIVCPIITDKA